MPDAQGNIKGISLSGVELPWERDRSKLDVSEMSGATAQENSQVPKLSTLNAEYDENGCIRRAEQDR